MAFFLQVFNELDGAALAVFFGLEGGVGAGVFQHRQIVQRNVRAAPGVGSGREVVIHKGFDGSRTSIVSIEKCVDFLLSENVFDPDLEPSVVHCPVFGVAQKDFADILYSDRKSVV